MTRIQMNNKGQWRFGNSGRWRKQRAVLDAIQASRAALNHDTIKFTLVGPDGSETPCIAYVMGWTTMDEYAKYQAMMARVA